MIFLFLLLNISSYEIYSVPQQKPVDVLAEQLIIVEQQREIFETTIEVNQFLLVPELEKDSITKDGEKLVEKRTIHYVVDGARWRMDEFVIGMFGPRKTTRKITRIWDGETFIRTLPEERQIMLAQKPTPLGMSHDCLSLFNGMAGPSIVSRNPLSNHIKNMRFLNVENDKDFRIYHFSTSSGMAKYDIEMKRISGEWRMGSLTTHNYGGKGSEHEGKMFLKLVFQIEAWGEFDGLMLPRIAYRDAYAPREKEPMFGRTTLERISAIDRSRNPPDNAIF